MSNSNEETYLLRLQEIKAALVYFAGALNEEGSSALSHFKNYSENLSKEIEQMNKQNIAATSAPVSFDKKRKIKRTGFNKDGTKRKQSLRNLCHGVIHKLLQEQIGVDEFRSLSRSFQFKWINDTYTDVVNQMSENGIHLDTEVELNARLHLITSYVTDKYCVSEKSVDSAKNALKDLNVIETKSPFVLIKTSQNKKRKMTTAIENKSTDDGGISLGSNDSDTESEDEDEE
jgi:hypothetical protein